MLDYSKSINSVTEVTYIVVRWFSESDWKFNLVDIGWSFVGKVICYFAISHLEKWVASFTCSELTLKFFELWSGLASILHTLLFDAAGGMFFPIRYQSSIFSGTVLQRFFPSQAQKAERCPRPVLKLYIFR